MNKKAFIFWVLGIAVLGWIGGGGASAQSIPPQCMELMTTKPAVADPANPTADEGAALLDWIKAAKKCIEEN